VRSIGIHLRVKTTLLDLVNQAIALRIPIFQVFLMAQSTRKLMTFSDEEIRAFRELREKHFGKLYLHGSYLVNLAGISYNGLHTLYKEISLAQKLGFTDVVLHPGSAHGAKNKQQGIDAVARALNSMLKRDRMLGVILENTAHGNMSIGSDVTDFYYIRQKLDAPERVSYCIDTSHAHVFGYDLISAPSREQFYQLLDACIGFSNISLIHLNDTRRSCGSLIDQHDAPGEGIIGKDILRDFVMHPGLVHAPLIMELPLMHEGGENTILEMVRKWHK
jgi:deoxyribonuclease-4